MQDRWAFIRGTRKGLSGVLQQMVPDQRDLRAWIDDALLAADLPKNVVVHRSQLNQTYAYQIMAGQRQPSRDKLIQLCFGMGLGVDDACDLLEHGEVSALRPAVRRDVVIAYCLDRGLDLATCDDFLWSLGEKTLADGTKD